MNFSQKNRHEIKQRLNTITFDVLVIGGGITGVGIALDATTRGMKTALVEMQDFAAGTSSRSTKLVHGGLRYLKQFDVKIVAEVGKEREVVYENGPHVTTPEWMLLPLHKGGTFGKLSTSLGLRVYDFLAGVKKAERRKMLDEKETLQKEPLIKQEGLIGGGYYVEYRTDDARLTIEVAKKAVEEGATLLNYTKMVELIHKNGSVIGIKVHDELSGDTYEIFAKKIVNATGPWVDSIREMDDTKKDKTLLLTKGVHIVIDQKRFPLRQAIYFDTPDGRMMFAIPRGNKAYIGTTDTFYQEDLISPRMTEEDQDYLIRAVNKMFPQVEITANDIQSSWAGIRPLILEAGKDPSEISRKDEIWESRTGLITIAGGKLTGYRKMAETIVDLLAEKLKKEKGKSFNECRTNKLAISGGEVGGSKGFVHYIANHIEKGIELGLTQEETNQLIAMYGANINKIYQLIEKGKTIAAQFNLPLSLFVQLQYALEFEMVATLIDFWNRRTGYLLFDMPLVQAHKKEVSDYMSSYFNWIEVEKENQDKALESEIFYATTPVISKK